jgi:hypothetical protein
MTAVVFLGIVAAGIVLVFLLSRLDEGGSFSDTDYL